MTDGAELVVDLVSFANGTPALSPATAADLVEAAVVCLVESGHLPGCLLDVRPPPRATIGFEPADPRAFASRADREETTERGATVVALGLLRARTGHGVVERARKRTGCDWYLGDDDGHPPFQRKVRMEVSGIREEDDALLNRRLREKLAQLAAGNDDRPGYAVVVGFAAPVAVVEATWQT